jgi:hypothetical protein
MSDEAPPSERVLDALVRHGLLLKQDKAVPSVVGIITRESLRTSWWSHPQAHLIFSVLSELADHPDVLNTKLLYRKDTLIHRALWPSRRARAVASPAAVTVRDQPPAANRRRGRPGSG